MNIPTIDEIHELSQITDEYCITIHMPTHPFGREQQDPIRLKNLLADADEQLREFGMRPGEIKKLLNPATSLLNDKDFWQHHREGLSVLISPENFYTFKIPVSMNELLVVGNQFHLKPLYPIISNGNDYYILAISQKDLRLLNGDRFEVKEIDLEDTPKSLQEALRLDDPEYRLQFHTSTDSPGSMGTRESIFHGHGKPSSEEKNRILRYFQKVNQGVMDLLGDKNKPLVLAGVDYLIPIYQEANDYPHIIDKSISGNPEVLDAEELLELSWDLVKPIFQKEREQELKRYQSLMGSGDPLASNKLSEIVPASHHGQVEVLFVSTDKRIWGTFDPQEYKVDIHTEYKKGDQDLLDLAAAKTLISDGKVFNYVGEEIDSDEHIAAIYRYTYEE